MAIEDTIAALRKRVEDVEAAVAAITSALNTETIQKSDMDRLRAELVQLKDALGAAEETSESALKTRVDALETILAALTANINAQVVSKDDHDRLRAELVQLKAALSRGDFGEAATVAQGLDALVNEQVALTSQTRSLLDSVRDEVTAISTDVASNLALIRALQRQVAMLIIRATDVVGPAGPVGSAGADGATGAQGPQGEQGPSGTGGTFWHPDLSGTFGESDELGEHPQYAVSGEYIGLSGAFVTHRDDTTNPHEATFNQVRDQQGGSDVTLVELEELSDGSSTSLHTHSGAGGDGTFWHPDLSGTYGESDELGEHPQYAVSGEYIGLSGDYTTHRGDTTNPHDVTFSQARDQEGGSDVTLIELEELTDGSGTALHTHADTLDIVCDRGSETNQDIHTSGVIIADQSGLFDSIFINPAGPDADSFLYFYEGGVPASGWFKWSHTYNRFECSHDFVAWGDIKTVGDLYFNAGGPEGDGAFYFYEAGNSDGAYIKWNDSQARFDLSHVLSTASHIFAGRNVGINVSASNNDAVLVFYKPTTGSEDLRWDTESGRFEFSHDLSIAGNLFMDGNDIHGVDHIYYTGSPVSGGMSWSSATSAFEFETGANVAGNLSCTGSFYTSDIYLNESYDATDAAVNFRTSNTGDVGPLTIVDALWIDDDSSNPLTSELPGNIPALHDEDETTEAKYVFDSKWSIGADLGLVKEITRIRLYDDPADQNHPANTGPGWDGIYPGGGYDSLQVYTSNDNATWTLRETIHPVPRSATRPCTIDIALSGTYSCRFVKLYCDLGGLCAVNGGPIGMAEIRVDGVGEGTESLRWDHTNSRFEFSDLLLVSGNIQIGGNAYVEGNIGLNSDYSDHDAILVFYKPGSGFRMLRWDKTNARFDFDDTLNVDGNIRAVDDIYVNADGPEGDGCVYFYEDGSNTGAHLLWDDSESKFSLSHSLQIEGVIYVEGNIGINTDYSDHDAMLLFYKPSSGFKMLKWDKTDTRFEFDDTLSMESHKIVNVTDPVNDQDATTKKYVHDNYAPSGEYVGLSGDYTTHRDDTTNPHEVTFSHSFNANGAYWEVTGVDGAWILDSSRTVTAVWLYRGTAGDSGNTVVDIHKNGTTIYSTQGNRPTIAYDDGDNKVDCTLPDVTSIAAGDVLTMDIDSVEMGDPADLSIIIHVE